MDGDIINRNKNVEGGVILGKRDKFDFVIKCWEWIGCGIFWV